MTVAQAMPQYASKVKILATDINQEVLHTCKVGIYDENEVSNVPDHMRKQWVSKTDDGLFSIKPELKSIVHPKRMNLNIFSISL